MAALTVVLLAAAGCGRPSPCTSAASCPEGTVCELDGQCRALTVDPELRLARSESLAPSDWGVTRNDQPGNADGDLDSLALGGSPDAAVYLAFGPLPPEQEVIHAVLTLHPHPSFAGPRGSVRVAVQPIGRFRGERLTARSAPSPFGPPVALRPVPTGTERPLRFDVTGAVERARRAFDGRLYLALRLVRAPRGAPVRFASPRHPDPDRRPRLSLLLR
jgi:hypothetical protein